MMQVAWKWRCKINLLSRAFVTICIWYGLVFFFQFIYNVYLGLFHAGNVRIVNITASSNLLYHDIYLKCEVQGSPSPDVWWTKNGSYIRSYFIRFEDGNRTLVITGAEVKHIGTYYCHARNTFSYANASFVLNLIGRFQLYSYITPKK